MKNILALALLACISLGALYAEQTSDQTVIATWQGGQFTKKDLDGRIDKIPPMYQSRYKTTEGQKQILESMCTEQMFYIVGLSLGLDKNPEVNAAAEKSAQPILVAAYRDREFKKGVVITEDELNKYYRDNVAKFFTDRPNTTILYIQVKTDSAAAAVAAGFAANQDFTDLMNLYSVNKYARDNSGRIANLRGGGYIPGVGRDPQLDSLITAAELNKLYGPVTTSTGIHFFKVLDRQPEHVKSFDECRQDVIAKVRPMKESDSYFKAIDAMYIQHHIHIDNGLLSRIVLGKASDAKKDSLLVQGEPASLNITVGDFVQKAASQPPQEQGALQDAKGRENYIKQMLEDKLFYLDAKAKGYADSISVRAELDQARRSAITRAAYNQLVVKQVVIPDSAVVNSYERNKERYLTTAARKIQVFGYTTEKDAKKSLKQAMKAAKKNDDAKLAELLAASQIKVKDGIIDNITKNRNIPGQGIDSLFSQQVWSAEIDKFSGVFPTAKGTFVFFRLLEDRPATLKPLDDVRSDVQMRLQREYTMTKFNEVSDQLKKDNALTLFADRLETHYTAKELFDLAEDAQKSKKFNDAATYYDQIVKSYKNGSDDYKALFMEAFLYAEEMNQPDKAKELFSKLLTGFPKGELHESAEYMLKSLNGEIDVLKEIESANPPTQGKE
jgi:peptidyl-prolyl cis-trans isomerase C